MGDLLSLICRQDARHRLVIAFALAATVFFSLRGRVHPATEAIATWDAFAFCVLLLAWLTILTTPLHKLRSRAREQDLSRSLIFVFVVVAACAALFAVGFLISVNKDELRGHLTAHLLLALGTVIFSWSLVHTVFGLRYAHTFYGDSDDPAQDRHAGGLSFPEGHVPDYFDFAYFSFVVGMTFQVSDVQVTSRRMRQLTLLHSVLSFGFNTVILALLINTVSSLL
jgi:uncharacterized membrane protein